MSYNSWPTLADIQRSEMETMIKTSVPDPKNHVGTGDWMQTYTGKRYYPAGPACGDIDPIDIATALGNMTRYNGHCRFYSVAEHCVHISHLVSPANALYGLLHDAAEAYLVDITRPTKRALRAMGQTGYDELTERCDRAIFGSLGMSLPWPAEVDEFDQSICMAEKAALLPRSEAWNMPFKEPDIMLHCWDPREATKRWLHRFCELTLTDYGPTLTKLHHYWREDDAAFIKHRSKGKA